VPINTHRDLRKTIQLIRPEAFKSCDRKWDGQESIQDFIANHVVWNIGFTPVTEAEILAQPNLYSSELRKRGFRKLRRERDRRLREETDGMMHSDVPMSPAKRDEWKAYRQALRDLPENTPDPDNIVWPTEPS
jgi:hypothetical protein